MVIALGFRVRSPAAVRFRQWAADKLKEYIVKGFVLDDDRRLRSEGRFAIARGRWRTRQLRIGHRAVSPEEV